jgi:ATP-dependent DNA ligase
METKADLILKANQLGVTDAALQTYSKEEIMDILADILYTGKRKWLPQLPVMLLKNVKDLETQQLNEMMSDKNWFVEEKIDGVRAKLHFVNNTVRIDTRHRSVRTYLFTEITDNFPALQSLGSAYFNGTVLDGELVMSSKVTGRTLTSTTTVVNSGPEEARGIQEMFGPCLFVGFDMLFFRRTDCREDRYSNRFSMLERCIFNCLSDSHIIRPPARTVCGNIGHVTRFFDDIVEKGGEGVVLKHCDGAYECGKRSKFQWKWKKGGKMLCFISGGTPGKGNFAGMLGAFIISVIDEKTGKACEVGAVQPGDFQFRKSAAKVKDDNKVDLRSDLYGKVVEVNYMDITVNGRLQHAVISRFVEDKARKDCKIRCPLRPERKTIKGD